MKSNSKIFGEGMAKAMKAIDLQLTQTFKNIAMDLLYDAVQTWEGNEYNMTGNTINSYASAVYNKGKVIQFYDAYDAGVQDRATAPYSYPGDFIYFYHQQSFSGDDPNYAFYGENERGVVRKYKNRNLEFQQAGRGRGDEDAKKFLYQFKPKTNNLCVCVVVGVPYASYLENVRKLDLLKDSFDNRAPVICKDNVNATPQLTIK